MAKVVDALAPVWTLEEASARPLTPAAEVQNWGDTLVLAPHPDDEALGCGGVIALLRQAGLRVQIAVLTDGSRSHPGSRAYPPARLVELRRRELCASAKALGVEEGHLHFLNLPDAQVPRPEAPEGQSAVTALRALMPGVQTLLVTWRLDPHCDHRAAYEYALCAGKGLAVRVIEYPVWVWENGQPGDFPAHADFDMRRVDIQSVLVQKITAIEAHRSQVGPLITDDPKGFTVPVAMLEHFKQPWELFLTPRSMDRPADSLPPSYFDGKYAEKLDYWDFETSPYEAQKYAATLAALPNERYTRGFEIGCSVGVLTEQLALRCGELLAIDVAEAALQVARERCAPLPQVTLQRMQFPREQPDAEMRFDLILVSEVGYYWSRPELQQGIAWLTTHLELGGTLLLVHYTPPVSDYPLTGDEVHETFLALPEFHHRVSERAEKYRLDLLIKAKPED